MRPQGRAARARKRRINRGALPAHLPRIEVVVDIDDKTCPCCQGELHRIGEDKSERLDMVPAQFRVLVTRRPKYACRACEDGVVQAPAPARLIEGGLPTEATVAQVLVSKYADHLPLYRQAQIYARQGIDLDRSTLADWVGHAAWHLRPLHERLLVPASGKDPSCSPTRRRCRCSIPAGAAPRPASSGPMPPTTGPGAASIRRASPMSMRPTAKPSGRSPISPASRGPAGRRLCRLPQACRARRRPARVLLGAYAAQLLRTRDRRVRRRSRAKRSKHIAAFYAIEKDIRGRSADERRLVRQQKSRPLADAFEPWLRAKLALISQKSKLAEAIRYALSRWEGLTRFIDDGRIELDNNTVERSIRPHHAQSQKCTVRRIRRWCRTLGRHRVSDRDLQAQRRRSARLSHRRPDQDRQRSSKQRYRPAAALGLPTSRPQSRGLRTTLTTHQTVALTSVRRPKTTPIHELERYMRCKDCSRLQGRPYKRSHLVALRRTKISVDDPASTWWPGERD